MHTAIVIEIRLILTLSMLNTWLLVIQMLALYFLELECIKGTIIAFNKFNIIFQLTYFRIFLICIIIVLIL